MFLLVLSTTKTALTLFNKELDSGFFLLDEWIFADISRQVAKYQLGVNKRAQTINNLIH